MAFCLPQEAAKKFVNALKEGKIIPEELITMSSEERRSFLAKIVGEADAKEVNAQLESRLILKDQKRGLITWAKNVGGLKETIRKDIIARIEKMDKVLNPADEQGFLADLASKKLGTDVTYDEAQKITELSNKVQEAAQHIDTPQGRTNWGLAQLDLHDYVESLLPVNKEIIANIANLPKTVMSTLDFSAILRQGWGLTTSPRWWKSLVPMFKYAFSENAFRNLQADIISRPTYPMMKASGLRLSLLADKLSGREEAYMSKILDKVPGIRGSERAYVGFLSKLRADEFDYLVNRAKLAGEHIGVGTKETKDIASFVNDFTGSGNIGAGDKYASVVPVLNSALFSPRKVSATINMFNPVRYVDPRISKTARIAALKNLIGSLSLTAGILTLASMNSGTKVETDSTSSDFGKIVVGKTRYDLTGGNGTYAVLLSRLLQNKTKSTTSGKVRELGTGYKPTTRADLLLKFGRNKLSPVASYIADFLYGSDAVGKPFNATQSAIDRAYPLIINDIITVGQQDPSQLLPSILADEFGVGVQTY